MEGRDISEVYRRMCLKEAVEICCVYWHVYSNCCFFFACMCRLFLHQSALSVISFLKFYKIKRFPHMTHLVAEMIVVFLRLVAGFSVVATIAFFLSDRKHSAVMCNLLSYSTFLEMELIVFVPS